MAEKITRDDGTEVEVFTAEEVQAARDAAAAERDAEHGKTRAEIERERDEARTALGQRTTEFAQFRKLSDDQVKKLDEKDRIIYENGLDLQKANDERIESEKKTKESQLDSIIKARAKGDEKVATKIKDMYGLIGLEANTVEDMERKVTMAIGSLVSTEPDMLASINGLGGNGLPNPPKKEGEEDKSFVETERGQKAAKELELTVEAPK